MSHAEPWSYPGARWWKFDFHTHTAASLDTYWALHSGSSSRAAIGGWRAR